MHCNHTWLQTKLIDACERLAGSGDVFCEAVVVVDELTVGRSELELGEISFPDDLVRRVRVLYLVI